MRGGRGGENGALCAPILLTCLFKAVHNPRDAIAHMSDVEVQEITQSKATQAQIAQHLPTMDRQNRFHGFQFDDHEFVHQQIKPITVFDCDSAVTNGDVNLSTDAHTALHKFMRKANFISALEQTWADSGMNGHRGPHYLRADPVFSNSAVRLGAHCASSTSSALSFLSMELLKTLPIFVTSRLKPQPKRAPFPGLLSGCARS